MEFSGHHSSCLFSNLLLIGRWGHRDVTQSQVGNYEPHDGYGSEALPTTELLRRGEAVDLCEQLGLVAPSGGVSDVPLELRARQFTDQLEEVLLVITLDEATRIDELLHDVGLKDHQGNGTVLQFVTVEGFTEACFIHGVERRNWAALDAVGLVGLIGAFGDTLRVFGEAVHKEYIVADGEWFRRLHVLSGNICVVFERRHCGFSLAKVGD